MRDENSSGNNRQPEGRDARLRQAVVSGVLILGALVLLAWFTR